MRTRGWGTWTGSTITTSVPATGGIAERAPDMYPVQSSGRTSRPAGPVDSRDVRIGVVNLNTVGSGGLSCRSMAIPSGGREGRDYRGG